MSLDHFFRNVQRVDMPEAEYHALPRLNASTLKKLVSRPKDGGGPINVGYILEHGWPAGKSPSMALGSLVHCLVLEPEKYAERYACWTGPDRRLKEGKVAWAEYQATLGDRTEITQEALAKAEAMRDSVRSHKEACAILDCDHEVTVIWDYFCDGVLVPMKARLDAIGDGWAADLKTTMDASPEGWPAQAGWQRYHLQVALYHDAAKALQGADCFRFPIVAVENARPPYPVGIYPFTDDALDRGRMAYMDAIRLYQYYQKSGWPKHYNETAEEIDLPAWA
jgi:hypothetical protein